MTSFMGEISVDGVPLCIEGNDSRQLQRCLTVANAISNAWLSDFIYDISSEYDYSAPLKVTMKAGCNQYAPAIYFIANKALGSKVEVVEY